MAGTLYRRFARRGGAWRAGYCPETTRYARRMADRRMGASSRSGPAVRLDPCADFDQRPPHLSSDATVIKPYDLLRQLFDCAIATADPQRRVPAFLPERPKGRTLVLGAGKASAAMARAVEERYG